MDKTLEQSIEKSTRLMIKFPDRIPVIIEQNESNFKLDLQNYKYLLEKDMSVSTFICIIRTKINKTLINSKKAIFTFVKNDQCNYILIPMNETMGNIYDSYKQIDGFLYIKFGIENTFG